MALQTGLIDRMPKSTRLNSSPFFNRAYGGYTPEQEEFYRTIVTTFKGKSVFDPMAGQGFALSQLATAGAQVWLGDINPAGLVLASLRDPRLLRKKLELVLYVRDLLKRLGRRKREPVEATFVPGWLAPSIRRDLTEMAELAGADIYSNPFSFNDGFWDSPDELRFTIAIAVLAARDLVCFRSSDNVTWFKPGGLLRDARIINAMLKALGLWSDYAKSVELGDESSLGSLSLSRMNAEEGIFPDVPKVDTIITSPPYANRLDYTRMWAPESEVLAAMFNGSIAEIKARQIGTTVIEGRKVSAKQESTLPASIRRTLKQIKTDPTKFSDIYYYPFFRNYALSIASTFEHLSTRLRKNGTMLVFVRDTVRKDALFSTGDLIRAVLTKPSIGLQCVQAEQRVIRRSIGFLRKATNRGLYGLAQLEWWLVFRKAQ